MNKKTIYVPPELQPRVKEVAGRMRKCPAQLIRTAIEDVLRAQDQRLPSSLGVGKESEIVPATPKIG